MLNLVMQSHWSLPVGKDTDIEAYRRGNTLYVTLLQAGRELAIWESPIEDVSLGFGDRFENAEILLGSGAKILVSVAVAASFGKRWGLPATRTVR